MWLECLERVSLSALVERPIMVIGERGTGKELIAERLHAVGPYVMERGIAESIAQRATQPDPLLNRAELASVLADYQAESGITLEASQIDALAVSK